MPEPISAEKVTRRRFLKAAVAGALCALLPSARARAAARGRQVEPMKKTTKQTVLSFYCDDTSVSWIPAEAFTQFVDYLAAEGVRGESTVLLGSGGEHGLLSRPTTAAQRGYIAQLHRAADQGLLDANMEIMTHGGRFDFGKMVAPEDAIHEGLWLHEPEVSLQTYQDYFGHILAEGEKIGVRFSGLTWPGCGCEACTKRYEELRQAGHT